MCYLSPEYNKTKRYFTVYRPLARKRKMELAVLDISFKPVLVGGVRSVFLFILLRVSFAFAQHTTLAKRLRV